MLAQGFLSPIETARTKLQEQIGNFLQGRAKLNRLMGNPSLTIQGQARGLYATQTALETQLQNDITPKLQKINAGVWDSSDLLALTWFTMQIVKQINAVSSLERQAGGGAPVGMFGDMDMTTMAIGGIVLVGLGIMSGVFFGRSRSQTSP